MATLKEKQALLRQVEEQIQALQDEYDEGVNEKESLGKSLVKLVLVRKCQIFQRRQCFQAVRSQLPSNIWPYLH